MPVNVFDSITLLSLFYQKDWWNYVCASVCVCVCCYSNYLHTVPFRSFVSLLLNAKRGRDGRKIMSGMLWVEDGWGGSRTFRFFLLEVGTYY